ncbi:MAG: hypothetical protein A3F13_05885 [Gammaproteobacteria bacterium RIFCSPHIGHO2_12_FULL_40_19]|nr:MAG: hypothetical protein A3F13_05885 [Gammaproteobacteria bacterium RIFCSPHIGHO2_12_FULL_40_19]
MPLYEYHCTHCDENTELLQKTSDEPAKTCPNCHQDNLVKQISSTSFQLKGAGWYVTDFKNKKDNKPTQENKTSSEKSEVSKPSEKTDKKD